VRPSWPPRCGEEEPRAPGGTPVGARRCGEESRMQGEHPSEAGAHRRAARVEGCICLLLLLIYHCRCRRGSQVVVGSLGGGAASGDGGYDEEHEKALRPRTRLPGRLP
ncbi:unnamed protein product, partial [Urochloa humidicola]